MKDQRRLEIALLALRLSIVLVLAMWTWDKFRSPEHAAGIFAHFYGLGGIAAPTIYAIGVLEISLIVGFLVGFARTWTYGLVLAMHAVSTLASYPQYLHPFASPNLLFFAAWPMLAACFALFLLRDHDRLFAPGRRD